MPAPPGPLSYLTDDVSNKDQTKWEKLSTYWSVQAFKKNSCYRILGPLWWRPHLRFKTKVAFLVAFASMKQENCRFKCVWQEKRDRETVEWTPSPWSQTVLWEETGQRSSVCVQLCVCVLGGGVFITFQYSDLV